jgi:hypothetical protein
MVSVEWLARKRMACLREFNDDVCVFMGQRGHVIEMDRAMRLPVRYVRLLAASRTEYGIRPLFEPGPP